MERELWRDAHGPSGVLRTVLIVHVSKETTTDQGGLGVGVEERGGSSQRTKG